VGLREKRLDSDMQSVMRLCGPESPITLVASSGSPVDRYQLRYLLPGLVVQDGAVVPIATHLVEVYLTLGYPRQAPQCRMLTPIFHPNIAPHAICVGDHWSAGESLAALLVRIAEMICFQSYNVKSPLNGDAARWAEEHARELPLLRTDLSPLLGEGRAVGRPSPAPDHERPPGATASPFPSPRPSPAEVAPATAPVEPTTVPSGGSQRVESHPPGEGPGEIVCGACGAALALTPGWSSRWARCPMCGRMLTVESRP